jgi:hypothetical protein
MFFPWFLQSFLVSAVFAGSAVTSLIFDDFCTLPDFPVVLLSLLWLLFVELGFRSQERDPAAAGASHGPQHQKNSEMLRCQNAKRHRVSFKR